LTATVSLPRPGFSKYQISNPSLLLPSRSRLKSFIGDPFTVAPVTDTVAELMSTIATNIRFCEPATLMTTFPVAALAPSVTALSNTGAAGQEIVAVSVGVFVTVGVLVEVGVTVGVKVAVSVAVSVEVLVGVLVEAAVAVSVGVLVTVKVLVNVPESVAVLVAVLVAVSVAVLVLVFVGVSVKV